jgi:hypothetical protein
VSFFYAPNVTFNTTSHDQWTKVTDKASYCRILRIDTKMPDSQLLNLPGEILNQIYQLLLTVPPPGTSRILGADATLHPQILAVCRKVYREGREILYGSNTFIAHPSQLSYITRIRRWSKPIRSRELIAMIRRYHIYVRPDRQVHFTAEAARDAFSGIECLTVEVLETLFEVSDIKVMKHFEKVRAVRRARIFGSVTRFQEYATWLENVMMSPKEGEVLELEDGAVD